MGHYRWFRNQFASFFPVLHCPLGPAEPQACPFPDVVFPPLPQSALSSSTFHCALQDGFGQTWWAGDMTIPLQFASLYDGQEVFVLSDCLVDLSTAFLVGNMAFIWDALYLAVAPHFHGLYSSWSSVRVHDSQAHRKMDVTRGRISRILELREILLSFQTGFNLVNAADVCAILESISALEPSSVITEPRYLKLVTVSSFCLYTASVFSVLMPLMLYVISLIFSAFISMP